MQGELGEILRDQGHHAGVVGAGRDLAEPHLVASDEQLHPEQAMATQGLDHLGGDLFGAGQRQLAHRLGLPGFAVVTVFLTMAYGIAEVDAVHGAHGEQGYLVLEGDEAFDYHLATAGAPPLLGIGPALVQPGKIAQQALALAGGAHHGFHHAGQAYGLDGGNELLLALGEAVGGGGEAQLFGGEPADPLPVHGELGGAGVGHDPDPFLLKLCQGIGGDGFNLGDDEVGLDLGHQGAQGGPVEHVQHLGGVGDLHGGGIGVAVGGDHFYAKALQLDGDFLAEFA
ncbi:hypothetical protein D3C77_108020 [compost metagenome]